MPDLSWSSLDGQACLRVSRVPPDSVVEVRPSSALDIGNLPASAGTFVADGEDLCFIPRFGFADGTAYSVIVDGVAMPPISRAAPPQHRGREPHRARAHVVGIFPTATEVPRNLLRLYVWFSDRMSEDVRHHVHLVDSANKEIPDALLPMEQDLWDSSRRRLTVLLDPARIKRGLVAHREIGYPLEVGSVVSLLVDDGTLDARRTPISEEARRSFVVAPDERRHVEPRAWAVRTPQAGTTQPLIVNFGRALDHGLLSRCLTVTGPALGPIPRAETVPGTAGADSGEGSWRFHPLSPWRAASYELVVDAVLEDLAGNSVARVFDRDLERREDDPRTEEPVGLPFRPL